jgi:signal peptidase
MTYDEKNITNLRVEQKRSHLKILLIGLPILIILVVLLYSAFLVSYSLKGPEDKYIFGLKAYLVETASMEPELQIGDVIIIKKVNSIEELEPGQIITFKNRGEIITHRIQSLNLKLNKVRTKGDSNSSEDIEAISTKDIIGRKILRLPKFNIAEIIARNGMYIFIIVMIITTIFMHRSGIKRRRTIRRRKKKIEDMKNEDSKIGF